MDRFKPAFCRTCRPGWSTVPLGDVVIARTLRFSTRMRSKRRARSVEVCSAQFRRRSACRAVSRARARLTCARRLEAGAARARRRCSRRSRRASLGRKVGAISSSPVDSAADTTTPRSSATTCRFPGAGITGGTAANATCQRPARSRVTRKDLVGGTGRDQRNRTQPSLGTNTAPQRRFSRRTWAALGATLRNPSCRPRLRQPGGEVVGPRLLEVPQRLLLDDHASPGQPGAATCDNHVACRIPLVPWRNARATSGGML
jgi:hypothetical protein